MTEYCILKWKSETETFQFRYLFFPKKTYWKQYAKAEMVFSKKTEFDPKIAIFQKKKEKSRKIHRDDPSGGKMF